MNQSPAQLLAVFNGKLAAIHSHARDMVAALNPGLPAESEEFQQQYRQRLLDSRCENKEHERCASLSVVEARVAELAALLPTLDGKPHDFLDDMAFGTVGVLLHALHAPASTYVVKVDFEDAVPYGGDFQEEVARLDLKATVIMSEESRLVITGPVQLVNGLVIGEDVAFGDGYWKKRPISGTVHIPVAILAKDVVPEDILKGIRLYVEGGKAILNFSRLTNASLLHEAAPATVEMAD